MKTFLVYCKESVKGMFNAGDYCIGTLSEDKHNLTIVNKESNTLVIKGIDESQPFYTSAESEKFYIMRQLKPVETIQVEEWLPDLDNSNWLVLFRKRTLGEVYKGIVQALKEQGIWDMLDYFQIAKVKRSASEPFPDYRWISVFPVKGGNEGYYFHIEAIQVGKRDLLYIGKTLDEDKYIALKINNILVSLFL